MPLTPHERRDLLHIERSRDAETITTAIEAVWRDNPTVDLLEIEQTFRAAAGTAYLVATAEGFTVIIGMKNWVAELDRLGRTPEQNRDALAAREPPDTV
jgi:hypothetical protein